MDNKKFSIIVPAYSEEENIPNLLNEINKAFSEDIDFEVIIVDDGSPVSLKEVLKIDNYSFNISIISNQYNLGQSKSIEIGLKNSTGHVIGLIDADCQNPPEELKKLYDFYNSNNFDAVISYRKNRKDEYLRKIISKLANLILKIFTKSKFKDLGSSLKVINFLNCLRLLLIKGCYLMCQWLHYCQEE